MDGNVIQIQWAGANKRRRSPKREVLMLRQAAEALNLKVIQYDHLVWYHGLPLPVHIAIILKGRPAYIQVVTRREFTRRRSDRSMPNKIAFKRRLSYMIEGAYPYLEVVPGTVEFMQAQIELWRMCIGQVPIRIAKEEDYKELRVRHLDKQRLIHHDNSGNKRKEIK